MFDLFKEEHVGGVNNNLEQVEGKQEQVRVVPRKCIFVLGPNNWDIVPNDDEGNILSPSMLYQLGYKRVFEEAPGLLSKRIARDVKLAWSSKISACIATAWSRGVGEEIIFCIAPNQLNEFMLTWEDLVEYSSRKIRIRQLDDDIKNIDPNELYERVMHAHSLEIRYYTLNSRVYYVVASKKNDKYAYYLIDRILIVEGGNLLRA